MERLKVLLVSSTAISAGLFFGMSQFNASPPAVNPAAPALAQNPNAPRANPCAAKGNPCAAKSSPCAAKGKPCAPNPCAARSPCGAAANPCNPCSPCGAGGATFSSKCDVPRLVREAAANPCAAKTPCAPKGSPCAAMSNPCAAKPNPCAAGANPCAAKSPCGATSPCNPCNPCGAQSAEISDREARVAYDCLLDEMRAAYAQAGHPTAKTYLKWRRYSLHSYQSATHGSRYVQNYANEPAKAYGQFEKAGRMPAGAQIAKDSFVVSPDGKLGVGPLFLMEKMRAGFNPDSGDWKYTMIMPDGTIFGETKGKNSDGMAFCAQCHAGAADHDHLMFLPAEHRVKRR